MLINNNSLYKVSAIVSAFNSEIYIGDRLQNLVDQTLYEKGELEIIIVDSNSPQNEEVIVKDFMKRVKHMVYIRTSERETVYGAWNRGIQIARGMNIVNANTDDRFALNALELMANQLEKDSSVNAVYGDWLQTGIENDQINSKTNKELFCYPEYNPLLFFHGQITSHAPLIRKAVFDKIGFFNEDYKVYGDRDFMLRFAINGFKAKKIPAVVGLYYKNPKGLEFSNKKPGEEEFKALLDQYLSLDNFIKLFKHDGFPSKMDLAEMYACVGAYGKDLFKIDDKHASNLGTAGVLFRKALDYDKSNFISLNNMGIICILSGKQSEAIQFFEKAHKVASGDRRSDIEINLKMAKNGSKSLETFKWSTIKNKIEKEFTMKSSQKMYQEIQPLVENGWYDAAVNALEKLLEVYPQFAAAHNDLGVLYYKLGDKDKAMTHYENATELQADNITYQKNLADYYYVELGRVEDALRIYVRILESNPRDVETLLITGHICVALQKFDDAKDFYLRVLEIEPWNSEAGKNLDDLQKILAGPSEPQTAEEIYQAAQTAANEGRNQEAIKKLEALLNATPDHALAHNDLGVLYYKSGHKNLALKHYEKATQLEPNDMIFQKNLADFYCIEMDQFEKAMQIYVGVLEHYPEDIEALMAVGYICETLNKPDDAQDFYSRILDIEPWNLEARQKIDIVSNTLKAN